MSLVSDMCEKGTRVVESDGAIKSLSLLIAALGSCGVKDPRGVDPLVSAARWDEVLCFLVSKNLTLPGANEQSCLFLL